MRNKSHSRLRFLSPGGMIQKLGKVPQARYLTVDELADTFRK
jgi:hypothetical protein